MRFDRLPNFRLPFLSGPIRFACAASSLLFLFVLATPGRAQVSASISGRVTDPAGAAVSGATVTANDLETGAIRSATTDEAGRYSIPALAVGDYEVRVTQAKFSRRPSAAGFIWPWDRKPSWTWRCESGKSPNK